ncbi:hypothetical protein [Vitreimonas flagellata]|uniref:hypothetical protein n=1 Tax=Vitreimonas flagellata TaxID=2560861 RepID=UPI0010756C4B|nr:hypothetical protein [Vitreimonas flagellata]
MMTRVDVQSVDLITGANGDPIFLAADVGASVDGDGQLWIRFMDPKGNVFAVVRLPDYRGRRFVRGVGAKLGSIAPVDVPSE